MIVIYAIVGFGLFFLVDKENVSGWLKSAGALAATLPVLIIMFSMRRLTNETDEYMRLKHLKALRDGGLITTGVIFLVGFLQMFDVLSPFSVFLFGPLYFLAFSLSAFTNNFGEAD